MGGGMGAGMGGGYGVRGGADFEAGGGYSPGPAGGMGGESLRSTIADNFPVTAT
jgi:hypothetical protein